MKYTPLDIQRREFEKAFRGIEESEVRTFLHEVAAEWEELLAENQKLKEEILDSRERLRQYQDQDRIFRETLLQAQRTREDVLDGANREKELTLREAQFKADELIREAERMDAIVADFLDRAFGPARKPMAEFYRLIDAAGNPRPGSDQIGRMYRRLDEARKLAGKLVIDHPRSRLGYLAAARVSRSACCRIETLLQFCDQIFEIVDLLCEVGGARALGFERLLALGLLLLTLFDQRGHACTLIAERGHLALQAIAFGGDLLADVGELIEVVGERLDLVTHFGQNRAQHHGGAHRLQRVLGARNQRRRRPVADALECG